MLETMKKVATDIKLKSAKMLELMESAIKQSIKRELLHYEN